MEHTDRLQKGDGPIRVRIFPLSPWYRGINFNKINFRKNQFVNLVFHPLKLCYRKIISGGLTSETFLRCLSTKNTFFGSPLQKGQRGDARRDFS